MAKEMKYFDCDAVLGTPRAPLPYVQAGVDDLLAQMGRLHIGRALVRHRASDEAGPDTGNELALQETSGRGELLPVWMTPPDLLSESGPPDAVVDVMLDRGVAAAWMKPTNNNWVFEPWCCGHMLGALQERRVPLMVVWDDVQPGQLNQVMEAFPRLPLILLRTPRVGRNRIIYPLLAQRENLHVAVTPTYSVFRGIEDLCAEFGASRFLFGSGYPEVEGGAPVCMLTYAEISDRDRRAIAWGNMTRLLAEVRR